LDDCYKYLILRSMDNLISVNNNKYHFKLHRTCVISCNLANISIELVQIMKVNRDFLLICPAYKHRDDIP